MTALWMLVAGVLFSAMGAFVKLGAPHFTCPEMVFNRSAIGLAALFGLARWRRLDLGTPVWGLHLSRSLSGLVESYLRQVTRTDLDTRAVTPVVGELSGVIPSAAIEVHRVLGPGLLESIYEEALCHELKLRGIPFDRQKAVDVIYKEIVIKGQRLDLLG